MREIVTIFAALFLTATICAADTEIYSCEKLVQTIETRGGHPNVFCVTGQVVQIIRPRSDDNRYVELTIHDDSGYAVIFGHPKPDLTAGDIITARINIENFPSEIPTPRFTKLRRVAHTHPSAPIDTIPEDALSGKADWRYIRLRGIIGSAVQSELWSNWMLISIVCGDTTLFASAPLGERQRWPTSLVGAEVTISGVLLPQDRSARRKSGRTLHFPGPEAITIITAPPSDVFDAPNLSCANDLSPADIASLGRHTATGRVLARWNDRFVLLKLRDDSIVKVEFQDKASFRSGDFIQTVGLPESDFHHINLVDACARPAKPFPVRESPIVEGSTVLPPRDGSMRHVTEIHGRAIHLDGIVRTLPSAKSPSTIFHIESHGVLVSVNFSSVPEVVDNLQVGSRVDLTGIGVMSIENWRPRMAMSRIDGFFVVLNSPADVRVISNPSWWTPKRLLCLFAALIVTLVTILIWNVILRRLVIRKGNELLKEQLKHVKAVLRTEERTHLAVELHDTIAQTLTGVALEMDTAAKVAESDQTATIKHIRTASRALKSCRDELRNCLWDLRNRALEAHSMDEAIQQTIAPHLDGVEAAVRFCVPRERLSDNTAHAILRIVRELTVNAIRHGHATKVWIAGSIKDDQMAFSVRDNGCGFDPETAPGFAEGHYGLLGIQERTNEFEGECSIDSAPGKGTKVTISFKAPSEHKGTS